ncbi:hypothetical protein EDC01DRAFT_617958 [Geopyxis carbonaria]|nr:hypothetical protein EDC01DRAFT_617958 [Geopyxis carbonaria]
MHALLLLLLPLLVQAQAQEAQQNANNNVNNVNNANDIVAADGITIGFGSEVVSSGEVVVSTLLAVSESTAIATDASTPSDTSAPEPTATGEASSSTAAETSSSAARSSTEPSATGDSSSSSDSSSSASSKASSVVDNQGGADAVTSSNPQDPWATADAADAQDAVKVPDTLKYPVPDAAEEIAAAPPAASPINTEYPSFTAVVSSSTVALAYSGAVLPLQTPANHKPPPDSFRTGILAALASDPDTAAFGSLIASMPALFAALDPAKSYIFYAPGPAAVRALLASTPSSPLSRRTVYLPPAVQQQAAARPAADIDLTRVAATLETALRGATAYVDLGPAQGARIVSLPADPTNGTTRIVSGLGRATLVHADSIKFKNNIVLKVDSFFTLPRLLSIVLAKTHGRVWSAALDAAGLLDDAQTRQGVTVFAVADANADAKKLERRAVLARMLVPQLAYSPELQDGTCLPTLDPESQLLVRREEGGDTSVNGVKIVKSNVIAKNGVVHYLEAVPPVGTCEVAGKGKAPGKKSGAVRTGAGAGVAAMVAAAVGIVVRAMV